MIGRLWGMTLCSLIMCGALGNGRSLPSRSSTPTPCLGIIAPIQNYWFLSNYFTFGFNPFPYYAILGGFHALATCLVYRTSRQLRLSPLAAFCAAALFGIHAHWGGCGGLVKQCGHCVGGCFNLTAVSAYLTYLKKAETKWLGLTAVFFLLALITHEEAFILPVMLFIVRLLSRRAIRNTQYAIRNPETIFFIIAFLLTAVYLYTQFTRPNLTLEAEEIGLTGYLSI